MTGKNKALGLSSEGYIQGEIPQKLQIGKSAVSNPKYHKRI